MTTRILHTCSIHQNNLLLVSRNLKLEKKSAAQGNNPMKHYLRQESVMKICEGQNAKFRNEISSLKRA
jgi:hypothetical protein